MDRNTLVTESVSALREILEPFRRTGEKIGLVPTMGALHDGHLGLVQQSVEQCDCTVTSIFVNPTQFAAGEDLDKYPETLDSDVRLLEKAGVDIVFVPQISEIYPAGCSTSVAPPDVALNLEGEFRSTHFTGVCTVVLKLFNIVEPDVAFFGQKDFQQACVIKTMVADLNVDVEVVVCPIVRDSDGLALSSRNVFLDKQQREIALGLKRSLQFAVDEIESGKSDAPQITAEMQQMLIDGGVTSVDYAVVCDPDSLAVLNEIRKPVVVLVAAYVGKTRLIDNCLID